MNDALEAAARRQKDVEETVRQIHEAYAALERRFDDQAAELACANQRLHSEIELRRRLEEELRRRGAPTESEQCLDRFVQHDELLARLGHELRNSLAGVLNGIDVLNQIDAPVGEAVEIRAAIARQAGQVSRIVDDLLDLLRVVRGKVPLKNEQPDLVAAVGAVADDRRATAGTNSGDGRQPAAERSLARRRILLIDDRRDAILPAKKILELAGYEVFTAGDGHSGVALARELHPDAILCDIGLPGGMNGYDVAAAIRSEPALRTVYLVAVSGYGQEEDRDRSRQAGFDQHLTKPVGKPALELLMTSFPRVPEQGR